MKGYKTVLFNVLTLLLVVLNSQEFANIIPESATEFITMGVLAINVGLRYVTTGPVGDKLSGKKG